MYRLGGGVLVHRRRPIEGGSVGAVEQRLALDVVHVGIFFELFGLDAVSRHRQRLNPAVGAKHLPFVATRVDSQDVGVASVVVRRVVDGEVPVERGGDSEKVDCVGRWRGKG